MSVKIGLVSLGCAKNLVDSEVMLGQLHQAGYTITNNNEEAEVLIVNTCGFISTAKEESINTILELAALKEEGTCRLLVVVGCLVQKYHEELKRELPEVDIWLGTDKAEEIAEVIEKGMKRNKIEGINLDPSYVYSDNIIRLQSTPKHTAYLKIAEG
ncbi:MAG: 30S ribosomal protein S12 methylthiotransferase RimO, partial [Bacillota bacterium]|nr:30S ribosomal protein S12 methylthiotransferase RimO [Bacillota bacterium]